MTNKPKMPKKVKEWAEKQKEPAFAKTCWYVTTEWFKQQVKRMTEKFLEEEKK